MATLVSPGVSVQVIDSSFYIPSSAPTVPLIFLATQANKMQPDGVSSAVGTTESSVVRTVTSIGQSVQLYGIPHFWADNSGNQFNGDARNEYGLYALNQFLAVGNLAYVVRANLDLTDAATTFIGIGTPAISNQTFVGVGNGTLTNVTATSAFVRPQTIDIVFNSPTAFTVQGSLSGIIGTGTVGVAFTSTIVNFTVTVGATAFSGDDYFQFNLSYVPTTSSTVGNGVMTGISPGVNAIAETWTIVFTSPTTFTVTGSVSGPTASGIVGSAYSNNFINFTITAGSTPFATGGVISTLGTVVPGSGYTTAGTYTGVSLTGGTGSGAKATIVVAGGVVTSATLTTPGTGYTTGDVLSAAPSAIGGSGTGFSVPVSAASTHGDEFQLVLSTVHLFNPLGANDAAKRVMITTALAAEINNNTEVQSDIYQYNLILAPGYWEVVADLIALSTSVNSEAFVIGDTPSTQTAEQTATWAKTSGRANSTSAAYYYPWGLGTNLDGTSVVVAPSGIALATYAYSDNVSYVWFAPAGATRGIVTGISKVGYVSGAPGTAAAFTQVNLNQGQRDNLYQSFTNINPIVYFPSQGLLIWGQKTSAPAASNLDRVNVMRLVMYIVRQLRIGSFPFVFEPNDSITQANLASSANSFLNGVLTNRGLYDFVVLCNASNNPPSVVQSNELVMDVAIKPTIAAEFVYIPITVLSTGATLPS